MNYLLLHICVVHREIDIDIYLNQSLRKKWFRLMQLYLYIISRLTIYNRRYNQRYKKNCVTGTLGATAYIFYGIQLYCWAFKRTLCNDIVIKEQWTGTNIFFLFGLEGLIVISWLSPKKNIRESYFKYIAKYIWNFIFT